MLPPTGSPLGTRWDGVRQVQRAGEVSASRKAINTCISWSVSFTPWLAFSLETTAKSRRAFQAGPDRFPSSARQLVWIVFLKTFHRIK